MKLIDMSRVINFLKYDFSSPHMTENKSLKYLEYDRNGFDRNL